MEHATGKAQVDNAQGSVRQHLPTVAQALRSRECVGTMHRGPDNGGGHAAQDVGPDRSNFSCKRQQKDQVVGPCDEQADTNIAADECERATPGSRTLWVGVACSIILALLGHHLLQAHMAREHAEAL